MSLVLATLIIYNSDNIKGLIAYYDGDYYNIYTKREFNDNRNIQATVYINNTKCENRKIDTYTVYPSRIPTEVNITKANIPEECYIEPKPSSSSSSTQTSSSSGVGGLIASIVIIIVVIAACVVLYIFRDKVFAKCKKENAGSDFQKLEA